MKKLFKITAAIALLAACISCSDEFENKNLIRFSASSGNPTTKTSYSGDIVNGRERVDWNVGDFVWIWCPEAPRPVSHEAYYVIRDGIQTDDYYSTAGLDLYSTEGLAEGLQWAEDDIDHHFFAISPTPKTNNSVRVRVTAATATNPLSAIYYATIPASQPPVSVTNDGNGNYVAEPDMNNLVMVSTATYPKESVVNLDFRPVVTAVEFTIMNGYTDQSAMNLSAIKLSSTQRDLAGVYTEAFGGTAAEYSDAVREVTVPFDNPVSVAHGKTLTFTMFLLGEDPKAIDNMTIEFVTDASTSIKTQLKVKSGNNSVDMMFPRSKKSYVTGLIVPGSSVWTISAVPDTVTAWELEEMTVEVEDANPTPNPGGGGGISEDTRV